ncbi:MAG: (1-_4)-alpha-D-glucan 1-alpha-D-glucosylmutase [Gaiellaceae bacterium]|nr:(1->4)-alpha-D-glucan 1-alpha-D-glucosylmutase [Gaiellaceae bacterium]
MIATYRLQLTKDFGFREALELVPYLRALGISHLYLSPSLEAQAGSTHGYDVIDPTRISEERGGEEAFRALCSAGLKVILDIVPNHMAASADNPWWADEEQRAKVFDVDPVSGRWRRFFDIDELAGVRVEDEQVFELTHRKILELVREGLVEGLRIDHPDGLVDPTGYLERLRAHGARHVWVEKIFEVGEQRRDWLIDGTVGYEFLNEAQALFMERAAEAELTELYAEFTGELRSFPDVAFEAKLEQARTFEPEIERLRALIDLPELPQTLASFPVYRTYVEPWNDRVYEADRAAIEAAQLSDHLRRVLLLEERGHDEFVARFQQTTGPVMAKGVEDTAFYRYNRLLALNEVGGEPGRFGIGVEELHERNIDRAARMPRSLLTTSTHDTKRSGDVRARIGALTRIPAEWRETVLRWRELNAELKQDGAPDPNEEYFLYQTLVGAWPIEEERLAAYMEKALREEKRYTSWIAQDAAWEQGVRRFVAALYEHEPFVAELERFVARIRELARPSILGQLLLKLTSPGVPDIYWGDELESLSLVDPDNRRPVDWGRRREALAGLEAGASPDAETVKLFVIREALALRARRPHAFEGAYRPWETDPRVFAFMRGEDEVFVAAANDELVGYEPPPGPWRDVLAGADFPTLRLLELS